MYNELTWNFIHSVLTIDFVLSNVVTNIGRYICSIFFKTPEFRIVWKRPRHLFNLAEMAHTYFSRGQISWTHLPGDFSQRDKSTHSHKEKYSCLKRVLDSARVA